MADEVKLDFYTAHLSRESLEECLSDSPTEIEFSMDGAACIATLIQQKSIPHAQYPRLILEGDLIVGALSMSGRRFLAICDPATGYASLSFVPLKHD